MLSLARSHQGTASPLARACLLTRRGRCCGRDTETFNQRVLAETDRSAVERERKNNKTPEALLLLRNVVRTGIHDNSRCVDMRSVEPDRHPMRIIRFATTPCFAKNGLVAALRACRRASEHAADNAMLLCVCVCFMFFCFPPFLPSFRDRSNHECASLLVQAASCGWLDWDWLVPVSSVAC
jgi:hypothetical protein